MKRNPDDVKSVPVPSNLPPVESKPRRDDEKGDRPAIEMGNRDRGPLPDPELKNTPGSGRA